MRGLLAILSFATWIGGSVPAIGQDSAKAPKRVLVVAAKVKDLEADHYLWAAETLASQAPGKTEVLEGGLAAALHEAREKPDTIEGILEVVIDVYTFAEEVRITCYTPKGTEVWKEKAKVNSGGSEEKLARTMFERALKKAKKRPECGK